jgi:2-octaprenyl-6-methoxyphenol hydroxylase
MSALELLTAPTPPSIERSHYDIAIVGGGIIGNTIALALHKSGLRIAIIEAQAESIAVIKNRAYALSLLSGEIYTSLGIWSEISPHIAQFSQIQISDADYPGVVELNPQDLGTEVLGYGVTHELLLNALESKLATIETIDRLCPVELVGTQSEGEVTILSLRHKSDGTEHQLSARLTIGADGAKSPLRNRAGIETIGWNYWQSCVTATIKPEIPHRNIAYERFWYAGPIGVLPLADGRCQVVWTVPHQEAAELLELPVAEFIDRLEHRTGGKLGKLALDSNRWLFPVKLMQSQAYIHNRLALVGDAAHCCHPVAGQGMNLGIRDAATLAEIIIQAHQQGEDIGSLEVLQRYDRWRKPQNLAILAFTDFLDRLFSTQFLPIVWLRRTGLFCLDRIPVLKHVALRLMTGKLGRQPFGG